MYAYDGGGNLTKKTENAYTTGTLGAATSTITYSYGNTWKDQLTSYNGESIAYDAIGNPTTYRGWSMSWRGRNLTGASKGGTGITYTYDKDGLRTGKTVGGTTTTYAYQGSLLMAQQSAGKTLYFSYDSSGKALSVNYNGTEYYYLRNGQGDTVGLLDETGKKVVSYSYDSWGKLISTTGTLAGTLGKDNPFRYRGYYYDEETGLYWLLSRYYDPEVGRFISADEVSYLGADGTPLSYNLYAYCNNSPANSSDSSGHWPTWGQVFAAVTTVVVSTLVAAAVVAAAPVVSGTVMSAAFYYGATAKVLAMVTNIGCAVLSGGVTLTGVNRTIEALTGTNYAAKVVGEQNYENIETAVNLAAVAIVTMPQTTPYPSTGRSKPKNLNEQVGMNFAKANADAGEVIVNYLKDSRMPGWLGWQKYQINYPGTGVNIHYVGNKFIPIFFDFKFK